MDNYYNESTGELLTRSAGKKKKLGAKYIAAALVLVAVIAGAAGFLLHENSKYNKQVDLALGYLEEGNYEQAEIEYAAAVAMKPRKVKAREGLAYTRAAAGKYEQARKDYEDLYNDTNDEKYREAMEEVSDGKTPTNPDLNPVNDHSGRDRGKDDKTEEEEMSSSNESNGGRVAVHDGKIYYTLNVQYYVENEVEYYELPGGAVYVADIDGSNSKMLYDPGENTGVVGSVYKDGRLYVMTYVSDRDMMNTYSVVVLDPESGTVLNEREISDHSSYMDHFYIEDNHVIVDFATDKSSDYVLSIDLDTGEETELTDYSNEYASEGYDLTGAASKSTAHDGWVYIIEYCYLYNEDFEEYMNAVRLVRVRPDGSGREEYFNEIIRDGDYFKALDISVYDGVLTMIAVGYEEDADESYFYLMQWDVSTGEELDERFCTFDGFPWPFNNADGRHFYYITGDEEDMIEDVILYDSETDETTRIYEVNDRNLWGLYYYKDYLYVDVVTYGEDNSYNSIIVLDKDGNVIRELN